MAASRYKYAQAYGPLYNFQARSDNCFTQSDTTPDVRLGSLFYAINTTGTAITDFDNGEEGQVIKIVVIDGGSTSFTNGPELVLAGSGDYSRGNAVLSFIQHNTAWYEESRADLGYGSVDDNTVIVPGTLKGATSANHIITIYPSTEMIYLDASGGTATILAQVIGGTSAQTISIYTPNSAVVVVGSAGAGCLYDTGSTGNIVAVSGACYQFQNVYAGQWQLIGGRNI